MNNPKNDLSVIEYKVDNRPIVLTHETVQKYLAGGANITDQEFVMFASLCQRYNLDPFAREAYLIKFGNNAAQMVVGKDAILKRAESNPNYDGIQDGVIVQSKEGDIKFIDGTFIPQGYQLVGGWATAYRKDQKYPKKVTVNLSEYAKSQGNWKTMPSVMINKVAKVSVLRELFPNDLSGMYVEDEFDKVSEESKNTKTKATINVKDKQDVVVEVNTATENVIDANFKSSSTIEEEPFDDDLKSYNDGLHATQQQIDNISNALDVANLIKMLKYYKVESVRDLTIQDASQILKLVVKRG